MKEVLGNGLAFPIAVDRGGALALARGGDDVDQAIELILGTAPGERPMRPEFGCRIHECVFSGIDARTMAFIERELRIALDRWEPRIEIERIEFDLGRAADGLLGVHLHYRLRATSERRNLVYPFYVIPAEEPG